MVHAEKEVVAAYNKNYKYVQEKEEIKYKLDQDEDLPNVLFLFWESFTPLPKYVRDDVILNNKRVFNG